MTDKSSRSPSSTRGASGSTGGVSRRAMVRRTAAVVGGGAAAILGGTAASAQSPGASSGQTRRTFRAYVALGREASVQTLTLLPIGPRQVVVRTEAAQICYSTTRQGLGAVNVAQAVIPCHGGVGTVIEVGASVERVAVGQRLSLIHI